MATATKELRHLLLTSAAPGGRVAFPQFCHYGPLTAFKSIKAMGTPYEADHQCQIKSVYGGLKGLDKITIRACSQVQAKDQGPSVIQKMTRPLFSSTTLHTTDLSCSRPCLYRAILHCI